MKAGVFCHNGLGDGINCLVLSDLLHLNGFDVTTYQNTIGSMQNWFPHLPVHPYPSMDALPEILQAYDYYFVVHNDASEFVRTLILEGKRCNPKRMKVIYLYPSPHIVNEPYYGDCLTNPSVPVAENMRILASRVMGLPRIPERSPFVVPPDLVFRAHPQRIVVHPTSGRSSKNWPQNKFVKLALHLKARGFELVFVPGFRALHEWQWLEAQGISVVDFATLDALARFIYESGYLIGNDSGLAHMASALGLKTLTICRRQAVAKMWAPSFVKGQVLTPPRLIPNIRGLRLRDRHWHRFIGVGAARRAFAKLLVS